MSPEGKFDGKFQIGCKANKKFIGKQVSYNVLSQKLSFMIRTLCFFEKHSPRAGNLRVLNMHAQLH